jgi:hypothetical protein
MPFGRGARLCIAHGYSLNVIKSIIARVVTGHVIAEKPQRAAVLVTGFSLIPRPNPSLIFTRGLAASRSAEGIHLGHFSRDDHTVRSPTV